LLPREYADKIGHAATEALHKGDHALSEATSTVKSLAVEATGAIKHASEKLVGKNHVAQAEGKAKDAGDKKKSNAN